jgi:outer membrane protein TolC
MKKNPEDRMRTAVRRRKLMNAREQLSGLTGWDEGRYDESEGVPVLIVDGEQLERLVDRTIKSRNRIMVAHNERELALKTNNEKC